MELTLTAGCWIKFCKYLTKMVCFYNYYNLLYHHSYKYRQYLTPFSPQVIPPYSKWN